MKKIESSYARESRAYVGRELSLKETFGAMAGVAAIGVIVTGLIAAGIEQSRKDRFAEAMPANSTAYNTMNTMGIVSLVTGSPVEGAKLIGMAHGHQVTVPQLALNR